VHCFRTDQDIANLKWVIKLETFRYQIVKEWCTLVHHKLRQSGSLHPL